MSHGRATAFLRSSCEHHRNLRRQTQMLVDWRCLPLEEHRQNCVCEPLSTMRVVVFWAWCCAWDKSSTESHKSSARLPSNPRPTFHEIISFWCCCVKHLFDSCKSIILARVCVFPNCTSIKLLVGSITCWKILINKISKHASRASALAICCKFLTVACLSLILRVGSGCKSVRVCRECVQSSKRYNYM